MKSKKSSITVKIILSLIIVILLVCIGFMAKLVLIDSKTADSDTEDTRIAQDESDDNDDAEESKSKKSSKKSGNVLMCEAVDSPERKSGTSGFTSYTVRRIFGSDIYATTVSSVTFLDSLDDMPADAWDVSENQDGSVMAWTVENGKLCDLFIAGDGGVDANENSTCLFHHYENAEYINFNNCFYVEDVTDMSYMFASCRKLTELDLSGFDTSDVETMEDMFINCASLESLDLSGFDTSKVTNMEDMFNSCQVLSVLDVSSFDTSNVTDMESMFSCCYALTELDVSNFDTSKVTNMRRMFNMCKSLTKLDVSGFNMKKVENDQDMFADVDESVIIQ